MDELILQAAPEGFHRRVVVAIGLATHGGDEPMVGQRIAIGAAGVLRPTIGVVDEPR